MPITKEPVFSLAADSVIEDEMCRLENEQIILETDENLMDLCMDDDFSNQLDSLLDAQAKEI